MKKQLAFLLATMILFTCTLTFAEETPPAFPESGMVQRTPPEMLEGTPPELPEGEMPGTPPSGNPDGKGNGRDTPPAKPEGEMPGGASGGMPGGMHGAPSEYAAVYTMTEDATLSGEHESTGTDENILHVQSGTTTVNDANFVRSSSDSTGGDTSSFYGVGAAVLTTGVRSSLRIATLLLMQQAALACSLMMTAWPMCQIPPSPPSRTPLAASM